LRKINQEVANWARRAANVQLRWQAQLERNQYTGFSTVLTWLLKLPVASEVLGREVSVLAGSRNPRTIGNSVRYSMV